ncbi:FecR family protein [Paludibacter sp. 221]|uniref:FecR family protein n=1 Tax=Paludibacter sp. 221 TaxID=2302939 RepID=UPI0013D4FCDE|nr:FecR family protein [Paludibacter sp. 221]NDV45596.1 FecR family protein [Paludibacter sp. 221]
MEQKYNVYTLIEKQLSGKISENELIYLKEWYNANDVNKKEYNDYYALQKSLCIIKNKSRFEGEAETAYFRFVGKTKSITEKSTQKRIFPHLARYAAIFVVAFALGIVSIYLFQPGTDDNKLAQTIEIPFGSKSKVILPDGSTVWLNSGSRLSYKENFGRSNRDVILDGEGYFDVERNESLPFHVQSGEVKVHVLGTKFNFKSYLEDESARVTLVEGSLTVANAKNQKAPILLEPNQQAFIDKKEEKVNVKKVDALAYAKWTEPKSESLEIIGKDEETGVKASIRTPHVTLRNILFFDEEPLSQITRDLERVYNVKIEVQDATLQNERFYGDFRNEETITEILEIMAKNNNLHYSIKENEIVISRK